MAIEAKRSGQPDFNLHDEPDLSEAALDGVVGGFGGPTQKVLPKTKGDETVFQDISSLLADARSVAGVEPKLQSEGRLADPKTLADDTAKEAHPHGFAQKDVELLSDLTSKLSTSEMGKLLGALEHPDSKATAASILANPQGSGLPPKLDDIGAEKKSLDVDNNPHLGGASQIAGYIHETTNLKVLSEHLSTEKAETDKDKLVFDKTTGSQGNDLMETMQAAVNKDGIDKSLGSLQDGMDTKGKTDQKEGHVSAQYLEGLEQIVGAAIKVTDAKEVMDHKIMAARLSDDQMKAVETAVETVNFTTTNEQINRIAEHIATEKSSGVGSDKPGASGASTTSASTADPTSVPGMPTVPSMPTSPDAAAILSDVEQEFENLQEMSTGLGTSR